MELLIVIKSPFDLFTVTIKIDMSIINGLFTSQNFSIVTNIVPIFSNLNITVSTKVCKVTIMVIVVTVTKIIKKLMTVIIAEVYGVTTDCLWSRDTYTVLIYIVTFIFLCVLIIIYNVLAFNKSTGVVIIVAILII